MIRMVDRGLGEEHRVMLAALPRDFDTFFYTRSGLMYDPGLVLMYGQTKVSMLWQQRRRGDLIVVTVDESTTTFRTLYDAVAHVERLVRDLG